MPQPFRRFSLGGLPFRPLAVGAVLVLALGALVLSDFAVSATTAAQTSAQTSVQKVQPPSQLQQPRVQVQKPQVATPQLQRKDRQAARSGDDQSGLQCFEGVVHSLRIAPSGEITEITLSSPSNTRKPRFQGCGAKIADLPFLWDIHRDKEPRAEYCYEDGCLKAINLLW